jgi:hypothetical protein
MSSKIRKAGVVLVCWILVGALTRGTTFGQAQDGNLVGTILDGTGASVPNAKIEIENLATGIKTATTADENGFYRFNNLQTGIYKVTASAEGLAQSSRNVTVQLNKTATANVTLAVGAVTQEISIIESPELIDTTTAQVANTYSKDMIVNLPLAVNPIGGVGGSGGVYNLSLTGAGVTSSGGLGVGFGPSVGGQRNRNNNFTVEGTDNNRKDLTGIVVDVPVDAIKEFSVLQNQFSAEFGHSSGGQFNVILQNGTNQTHGSLFEYFQNRKLNAFDESAKRQAIPGRPLVKPRYDQNILGGTVGGPIVKNRFFYFGTFDYNPLGQSSTPSAVRRAPTAEGYALLATIPTVSQTNLGVLKQYAPPAPVQTQTTPICSVSEVPCPPAAVVDVPLGTFQIVAPNYQNEYRWLGSLDYQQSNRDQWRGRYVGNRIDQIDTGNGAINLPAFFLPRPIRATLISISEFHTFRPGVANELRLAYNRYMNETSAGNFKFPGLDVFPNLLISRDLNLQIGPNPSAPLKTIQNTYQLSENLSWFKDKHALKVGFDGRNLIAETTFISRIRGEYQYSTPDRFLRDLPPDTLAQRNTGGKLYVGNNHQLYFYANDNWKVTRTLSLNLGLRYEFSSIARSMKEWDLNRIADVPGVLTFRAPKPQKDNWAPRIGFAYSPGSRANLSIRGGFGLAYDLIFDNIGTNIRPPQATSSVDETSKNNTPGFLAAGGIHPDAVAPALTPQAARETTAFYMDPEQKLGYAINWNLGVQRVFRGDYTVDVRYLGNRGVHLLFQTLINRNAIVTKDHNLPLFFSQPSQETLDALPLTLEGLRAELASPLGNPLLPAGFRSLITAYKPIGNSEYHGLAIDVNKRFSDHILFKAAYTWSHLMDDSTAELNSTALSPRRPEDFNNIRKEWANSLLDRRHRASFAWHYQTPWFERNSNPVLQKVVGSWEFSGAWIYESPEYATPQSVADANLNQDTAGDRVVINNAGDRNISSDVTALTSRRDSVPQTVAYLVRNPNAYYIRAQEGVYTTSGRNILKMRPVDNFDLSLGKIVPFKEGYKIEFRVDMYNAFNHPQYIPGRPNRVNALAHGGETNYLTPGDPAFAKWDRVYSSNPRQIQLTAKVWF